MTENTEMREYAASIAASTIEMISVVNTLRDGLTDMLENEEDYAVAIQGAKETRDALIRDAYRIGLMPFMQPAAEEEDAGGSTVEEKTRAGRKSPED